MKRVAALMILLIIMGTLAPVSGKGIKEPTRRDVFLYDYFSKVLLRFESSLSYALQNNSYSVELANETLNELGLIRDEGIYYQEKGVKTRVMEVIPPFYEFSKKLIILDGLILQFQEFPNGALTSGILRVTKSLEGLLTEIDSIELYNGTEVLHFNTERLKRLLNETRSLALKVGVPKGLWIDVSNPNPLLYQNVTVFGSSPSDEFVTLVIEGQNTTEIFLLKPVEGFFSMTYSFQKLGRYSLYATQGDNTSNVVNVTVRKIPVRFIVDDTYVGLINTTINVTGKLVDYYGNSLSTVNITAGNESLITNENGSFSFPVTSERAEKIEVELRFNGDETHEAASKVISLIFKRYPVTITISGPSEVTKGQNLTVKGNINPAFLSPVVVYLNGEKYTNLTPNETGSFTLIVRAEGDLSIYAEFPGNDFYEEARSNVLTVSVLQPENRFLRIMAIALLGIALVAVFFGQRRFHESRSREGKVTASEGNATGGSISQEELEIPEDVGEAYGLLRNILKDKLGISESLTPREVLERLKDQDFYERLRFITEIHERAVYGGARPSRDEIVEFMRAIKEIVGALR